MPCGSIRATWTLKNQSNQQLESEKPVIATIVLCFLLIILKNKTFEWSLDTVIYLFISSIQWELY